MQVKNFINAFGIEKLNGKTIQQTGKIYKIVLSTDDLEYHSLKNSDWNNSKERLDNYHTKGNFRFYAMDEKEMCVWVYPTTDLLMDNEVPTQYGRVLTYSLNYKYSLMTNDTPQIKAIMKAISKGKVKNPYAADNKVKSLKKQQQTANKKRNWYNYLAQ